MFRKNSIEFSVVFYILLILLLHGLALESHDLMSFLKCSIIT